MRNRRLCLATQPLNLRALMAMLRAFSDVMNLRKEVAEGKDSEDNTGSKSINRSEKGRTNSWKVVRHGSSDADTSTRSTKSRTLSCWRVHWRRDPIILSIFLYSFMKHSVVIARGRRQIIELGGTQSHLLRMLCLCCSFATTVVWSDMRWPGSKHTQHIQSGLSSCVLTLST